MRVMSLEELAAEGVKSRRKPGMEESYAVSGFEVKELPEAMHRR